MTNSLKIVLLLFLSIFSILINNLYGNIGIFPIDSFAFFDTGYNILLDKHPFRDFWITTGPLVDYIQAIFFKLFGLEWSSYVLHASVFNLLITTSVFLSLNKHGLNIFSSFFYSISVAVLCYPISGTPFAYIHAYILSLISILIFTLAIRTKSNHYWFLLPFSMLCAFLCMQTPSVYINIILIFFLLVYLSLNFNFKKILYFILGSITILLFFILFLFKFEIPITSLIEQYLLFPISIGEYRVYGNDMNEISLLSKRLTFRNLLGHFKFINILLILIIFLTCINYLKKFKNFLTKEDIIINLSLVFSSFVFIFNQLIIYNQTFIFSLIPFLAGFLHITLKKFFSDKKLLNILLILFITFVTTKYHIEYNVKRKFMDLQNVDLGLSARGDLIHKKFNNLKWITPAFSQNPKKEIELLKEVVDVLNEDQRSTMLMTHYNFFQTILEKNLNMPNRWYTNDNNSYPLANHKYYKYYKNYFMNFIKKNNIEVIYMVGDPKIKNFKIYVDNICFVDKKINEITMMHELKKC